jgi:hypothetical protein
MAYVEKAMRTFFVERRREYAAFWQDLPAATQADLRAARREAEHANFTANARLSVPVQRAQLTLDLFNLTDASYRDVSGAPIAGRAAYLGLSWSGR